MQERDGVCAREMERGIGEEGVFKSTPEGFVGLWQVDEASNPEVDKPSGGWPGLVRLVPPSEGGLGEERAKELGIFCFGHSSLQGCGSWPDKC